MGKIPALQRKMISRAVGTPGADLSTNQALQTIGLAATLISAKIKKNQIALDKVDALRLSQDVDLDYQKKIGVLQQKYSNPDLDISNYKMEAKQAYAASEKILSTATNARVKQAATYDQLTGRVKRVNDVNDFILGMQVIKAETQTAFVHNQNTEIARNLDNSNDLFNHIDGAVARLASTFPTTMSPEEAAKKTLETEKGIVEAYINGQIDQRPGEGWPDFRDNKMLRAYFNDDERIKFENSFAEAITGVKKMEDIGLLKGHFEGLDQLILDGSLAGDVDNFLTFKNNILSAPGGAEKLGPDFMQDLERLITASRKQTALSSNRDPILGTKLTEERGRIMNYRDEDNGEIENVESFLQAANGYLMRMKRHEAEGDIKNEFYQKQIAPIRSAMIEIFENQKLPYRGLFGNKEVDAFHARPEKIQDELSKYDLLPEEKKTLQGEILFDLNEKLYKLEKEANREFTVEEEYDLFKIIMDGYLAPFKKTAFADDTVFYDTQTGEQFMYTAKGRVRTV